MNSYGNNIINSDDYVYDIDDNILIPIDFDKEKKEKYEKLKRKLGWKYYNFKWWLRRPHPEIILNFLIGNLCVLCVIQAGLCCYSIKGLIEDINDANDESLSEEEDTFLGNFRKEIVEPNTIKDVNENSDLYDYAKIAEELYTYDSGDFDKNLYKCYLAIGSDHTSHVLDQIEDYRLVVDGESMSFRNYLYLNDMFNTGDNPFDDKDFDEAKHNYKSAWEDYIFYEQEYDDAKKEMDEQRNETIGSHTPDSSKHVLIKK